MTSFEVLDAIADAYNPTQGIIWLCTLASAGIARAWRVLAYRTAFVILGLVAIRALEIADYTTQAFAAVGLDFSSHTAIAALMAIYLVALYPRYWLLWSGSLAAYVALMRYQGYHTMLDVVATLVVAGSLIGMMAPWFWRRIRLPRGEIAAGFGR